MQTLDAAQTLATGKNTLPALEITSIHTSREQVQWIDSVAEFQLLEQIVIFH